MTVFLQDNLMHLIDCNKLNHIDEVNRENILVQESPLYDAT